MPERCGDALQFEDGGGSGMVALRPFGDLLRAADHQAHEVLAPETRHGAARAGVAAVAQHRHGVADLLHLLELVADEQDADPVGPELLQEVEQHHGFVGGERGGRLVEQQHLGAERERLGDLDELHLGDAEPRHRHAGIDVEAQHVEPVLRARVDPGIVDRRHDPAREVLQHNVLAHREARDEVALLMHDTDAHRDRVARVEEGDGVAADAQFALVQAVDAGE